MMARVCAMFTTQSAAQTERIGPPQERIILETTSFVRKDKVRDTGDPKKVKKAEKWNSEAAAFDKADTVKGAKRLMDVTNDKKKTKRKKKKTTKRRPKVQDEDKPDADVWGLTDPVSSIKM